MPARSPKKKTKKQKTSDGRNHIYFCAHLAWENCAVLGLVQTCARAPAPFSYLWVIQTSINAFNYSSFSSQPFRHVDNLSRGLRVKCLGTRKNPVQTGASAVSGAWGEGRAHARTPCWNFGTGTNEKLCSRWYVPAAQCERFPTLSGHIAHTRDFVFTQNLSTN